jgi:hypothetical protein
MSAFSIRFSQEYFLGAGDFGDFGMTSPLPLRFAFR